jgi:hypothetical protein
MSRYTWIRWILAAALLVFAACSSDDDSSPRPTDTPTPRATDTAAPASTATASPSATVEPEPTATPDEHADHVEVEIGSSEDGGGQLVAEIAFPQPIPLFFNQCFGGSDEDCTGGQALFSDANPGFVGHHEHTDETGAAPQGAAGGVFPLADGTQVTIEIVAIDAGLSLRFGEVTLDTPGASTLVGSGAEFHTDGETLLLVDDRHTEQVFSLTFRLSADSGYTDSEEYTLQFVASNEDHHSQED